LRSTSFALSTARARPGDTIQARAHVSPRASLAIAVQARLTCTMFDHRSHQLFASTRAMHRVATAARNEYAAELKLPEYALRTGLVGDQSPSSDQRARRMLVMWTVDFEVRSSGGTLLHRTSRALDVPSGRRPKTQLRRMSLLAIDAYASIRNDMLFNWLVHLAVCDGAITLAEQRLLRDLLEEMTGMTAAAVADARIEQERLRRLVIDDVFLQRYVPVEARLDLYRALHALARCDGPVQPGERQFLLEAQKVLGLTADDVTQVEGDAADVPAPTRTS
jgi:uncharacterized tellurite resistance protein B-like protein